MTNLKSVLVAVVATVAAIGAAFAQPAPDPVTESGLAYAEVVSSVRSGNIFTVVVEFRTDDPDYPGETIYENIPDDEVIRRVFLDAADRHFELRREEGVPMMPEALILEPNTSGQEGAVVGTWEGVFEAPHHDLNRISLILPSVSRIGPFPIRNR